jgi:hypothetical protein
MLLIENLAEYEKGNNQVIKDEIPIVMFNLWKWGKVVCYFVTT